MTSVVPIDAKIIPLMSFIFFCFVMIRISPCKSRTVPDIIRVAKPGISFQKIKILEVPPNLTRRATTICVVERIKIPPITIEIEPIIIVPFFVLRGFKVKVPARMRAIPNIQ